MENGTTALGPDHDERFLSLRRALGVTSLGIKQMILQPGQRMRIHRQPHQEEVSLVLEGVLTVAIDGEETELGSGELMRVAPEVRRQLINYGPGRVLLIALGGSGEHDGRDAGAFRAWMMSQGRPPGTSRCPMIFHRSNGAASRPFPSASHLDRHGEVLAGSR